MIWEDGKLIIISTIHSSGKSFEIVQYVFTGNSTLELYLTKKGFPKRLP